MTARDPQPFILSTRLQQVAAGAVGRLASHRASPRHTLPLRVGTRGSPLALVQTRAFLTRLTRFCPVLRDMGAFQEHQINTTGDRELGRRLADIGGKGLFSKEIHEALAEGRIDFAVHSLKDLETTLPPGLVLACTLRREDARDALILRPGLVPPRSGHPLDSLPEGALVGCSSTRRQAQLSAMRPDLRFCLLRGNVQTRLDKLASGVCDATMLALAGLRRLGMEDRADIVLAPDIMVPAAGQGIVGVTVRESDAELRELLSAIEDPVARAVSTAERALLAELDGSCRTPIGGHAQLDPSGQMLTLDGLVAREDGSFLLRRRVSGPARDARRLGTELGHSLRADSPADIFADVEPV
ncbi:hydroxymethylbilane synthase [Tanticharoenia sakaeratensis]|uniref:Porphobilinogen deaminase n=1 Tax=Tanticharoenia sakaeratensis NBRC 103193 TaxID=1231623 RepID=A0A0D6MKW5_9PROT|nr:hydroxymethylbilane synthase [Tanticharoenia sakaeratensis]GAN53918.1 porphobilinogen deaminase [Tanticharoenia sakaeratensis NBRC 103193]GBQ25259.1 porphobilinogen deaminase [Tanticharoenia sakaeratensis NBRC 103193]